MYNGNAMNYMGLCGSSVGILFVRYNVFVEDLSSKSFLITEEIVAKTC